MTGPSLDRVDAARGDTVHLGDLASEPDPMAIFFDATLLRCAHRL